MTSPEKRRLPDPGDFFERAVLAMARGLGGRCGRAAAKRLSGFLQKLPASSCGGTQNTDISFSSAEPQAARFSVNDSRRRGVLGPVIEKQAKLLGADYDLGAISGFLGLGKSLRGGFQTTVGVEWPAARPAPALKLYLEESPGLKSAFEDKNFRNRLLALAGPRGGKAPAQAPEIIAMDFFPGGATDVKLYFRRSVLPERGLSAMQLAAMRCLDREPRCFYYEMKRLSSGGSKIYKVYEPGCADDPSRGISEICALYARLGIADGVRFAGALLKKSGRAGMAMLPTLCGAGVSAGGELKIDSYFRFIPLK